MLDVASLYEQHAPDIRRYCLRKLRSDDAEDIASIVWAKAWEKRGTYADRGLPALAWLYTIARNQLIDHVRALQARRPPVPLDDVDAARFDRYGVEHDDLAAAIGTLVPMQRRAVELRYFEGMPIAEVAARTGNTATGVKKLLHRAHANLRRHLTTPPAATPPAPPALSEESCQWCNATDHRPRAVRRACVEARAEAWLRLYEQGESPKAIARRFGFSEVRVRDTLALARKRHLEGEQASLTVIPNTA